MTKRRSSKRRKQPQRQPGPQGQHPPTDSYPRVPSAATFFRVHMLDPETMSQMDKATELLKPFLWIRDGKDVRRIQRAQTAEALIDLLPQSGGLGGPPWFERMAEFGPEVVPLVAKRLRAAKGIRDAHLQGMTYENLIGVLRWRGQAGAQALLECFDALGHYGQELACVALGLLGEQKAADKMWRFYVQLVRDPRQTRFVGALWGLIDLGDERVGGALASLLRKKRYFYELFGFLSLAGDARDVVPLLQDAAQRAKEDNMDATMALVSILQRIGKDAFLVELDKIAAAEDSASAREALADRLLSVQASEVQEYFGLFYRGLTADDLAQVFPGRI